MSMNTFMKCAAYLFPPHAPYSVASRSRTALEITLSWEQKWECRPILQLITRVPIILLRTHNSTHAALAGSLFHVQPHPYSGLWQSEHESFSIQTDTSGDRDISNELKKGLSQSYQSKFNQCGMEFRPYLKTLHNFTPIGRFKHGETRSYYTKRPCAVMVAMSIQRTAAVKLERSHLKEKLSSQQDPGDSGSY
ncbi:hypothetical protein ACO22_07427 [Paracoccidioides brasiliensis]|uniref:Uncharacterized protein n=1 Tax=Paracoccidioides brasiliensis TaxID=121759 RepID=A0A1D2J4P4_PARBR|nr:hypothetical protein ACO22_07427 [Paracoccidioides brasiliensis]